MSGRPGLTAQFWTGFVIGLILMGPVWFLVVWFASK